MVAHSLFERVHKNRKRIRATANQESDHRHIRPLCVRGHAIAVAQRAPRKSRRFKKADVLLCIFVVITQCLLNQASEGGDSGS
jgi:hypothetical protein